MFLKAARAIPGVLLAFLIVLQEAASRQPADADLQAAYSWRWFRQGMSIRDWHSSRPPWSLSRTARARCTAWA